MFEVGIVSKFEAAHKLEGQFGPASRLHGHTYRVELTAQGEKLRSDGTLVDLGMLDEKLKEILSELDYQYLNELEPFRDRNSSAENLCKYIFDRTLPHIRQLTLAKLTVKVWESPQAFACYWEELPSS